MPRQHLLRLEEKMPLKVRHLKALTFSRALLKTLSGNGGHFFCKGNYTKRTTAMSRLIFLIGSLFVFC
ncbi:MAG: hypothetical protein ACI9E1_001308 [Cryomorphaceae bacterium]|jgi:hypothetical protein